MVTPTAGMIVHVAGASGRCRAAIILDPGPVLQRVRVFARTAFTDDEWGDVAHVTDLRLVPVPDDIGGGVRIMDSWHTIGTCEGSLAMIDAAAVLVVGS